MLEYDCFPPLGYWMLHSDLFIELFLDFSRLMKNVQLLRCQQVVF